MKGYRLIDTLVPFFRLCYNYKIKNKGYLLEASEKGFVVVVTTHSSFLGAILVGVAMRITLKDEVYAVLGNRVRKDTRKHIFSSCFPKMINAIYVNGGDNRRLLRDIESVISQKKSKSLIIAPQGDINRLNPEDVKFKEGFAIPIINAINNGHAVYIVPAFDYGLKYVSAKNWKEAFLGMFIPGKMRFSAVFGEPIKVTQGTNRKELTKIVEDAVKDLMRKYS